MIFPLRRPSSTLTRVSKRSDSFPARSSSPGAVARSGGCRGRRPSDASGSPSATISSTARTDRPSATIRCASDSWPVGVREGEQRTRVSGGQHAGGHPALDRRRETQQPDRVGDLRPRAADAVGELLVGGAEVAQELVVGRCLLERVELLTVQVLQQGVAQHDVVGGVADDRRDATEPGLARCPPASLAHDELVPRWPNAADDDRLKQTDLPNRVDQLGHGVVVEDPPRLARVRLDRVQIDLRIVRGGVDCRRWRSSCVGGQCHRRQSPGVRRWGRCCRSEIGAVVVDGPSRCGGHQRTQASAQASRACFIGSPPRLRSSQRRYPRPRRSPRADGSRRAVPRARAPPPGRTAHRSSRVVGHDGLAVARRLGDPHRPRHGRAQHQVPEVGPHLVGHLGGEPGPRVVHGQQDRRHVQLRVEVRPDEIDVAQQLAEALQRVVLALDRDEHFRRGDQRVDGEQAQRRRAVDQHVVVRRSGSSWSSR